MVEKKLCYFKNKHNFSSPPKNACVTQRDKHNKNSKAIITLALCPGRCLSHHKGIENDQTIFFPRHSGKREVCNESMTKFSSIQFFARNATVSRWRNFWNIIQQVENKSLETAEYWSIKNIWFRAELKLLSKKKLDPQTNPQVPKLKRETLLNQWSLSIFRISSPIAQMQSPLVENFLVTVLSLLRIHLLSTRIPILSKWNKNLNTYVRSGMARPKFWVGENVWFKASSSILLEILPLKIQNA